MSYTIKVGYVAVLLVMLLSGCATKMEIQVDGYPIPENTVSVFITDSASSIKYDLKKEYKLYEGDEFFDTYEYLSPSRDDVHYISGDERLFVNVRMFNPNKMYLRFVYHYQNNGNKESLDMYEGSLSRIALKTELPVSRETTVFHFEILDKEGDIVYRSFRTRYAGKSIEGQSN